LEEGGMNECRKIKFISGDYSCSVQAVSGGFVSLKTIHPLCVKVNDEHRKSGKHNNFVHHSQGMSCSVCICKLENI
jgi:hypothetical protein